MDGGELFLARVRLTTDSNGQQDDHGAAAIEVGARDAGQAERALLDRRQSRQQIN
jgi:hypothetical protein